MLESNRIENVPEISNATPGKLSAHGLVTIYLYTDSEFVENVKFEMTDSLDCVLITAGNWTASDLPDYVSRKMVTLQAVNDADIWPYGSDVVSDLKATIPGYDTPDRVVYCVVKYIATKPEWDMIYQTIYWSSPSTASSFYMTTTYVNWPAKYSGYSADKVRLLPDPSSDITPYLTCSTDYISRLETRALVQFSLTMFAATSPSNLKAALQKFGNVLHRDVAVQIQIYDGSNWVTQGTGLIRIKNIILMPGSASGLEMSAGHDVVSDYFYYAIQYYMFIPSSYSEWLSVEINNVELTDVKGQSIEVATQVMKTEITQATYSRSTVLSVYRNFGVSWRRVSSSPLHVEFDIEATMKLGSSDTSPLVFNTSHMQGLVTVPN